MHAPRFDEPGLARPFVGARRFVIERRGDVIDPRIFRREIIRITQEVLDGRTDPGFPGNAERFKGGYPRVGEIFGRSAASHRTDLRPDAVFLDVEIGADREILQIGGALDALSTSANARDNGNGEDGENCDDPDDHRNFEQGKTTFVIRGRSHIGGGTGPLASASCYGGPGRCRVRLFESGNGKRDDAYDDRIAVGCDLAL